MKPEELKEKMKGVIIVQATPFWEDGSVDVEGLRENTRFLVEKATGKDVVLVPVGSTGEFYALSDEERKRVIKTVVAEANGKVPVLAGTAQAGTGETLKMSKYAEEVGADGVQIVLPYYQLPSEEGMYQHYKTVAEGINIGIMVYNNPAMTKAWIQPELMVRLSEIENIIADKENTKDIIDYYWMQKLVDPLKMKIFCGLGELMFSFEAVYGCPGFVTWIANFAPTVSYELYEAAKERDFERVTKVIHRLTPLLEFVGKICAARGPHTGVMSPTYTRGYMYVSVLKECMNLVGLHGGGVRLPLLGLTLTETEELRKILADLGLPVK